MTHRVRRQPGRSVPCKSRKHTTPALATSASPISKWGDGPPLLIVPELVSNVEMSWEHELYRRTLEHLGKHMTCVEFDKRGIGLSDRFDDAPTLEQRNEDILAVMDAVGWDRAHFLGMSEGASWHSSSPPTSRSASRV